MKISFIIPSWHYFSDPFKLQPYWELYYTTILKNQLGDKAEISLIDLRGKSKDDRNDNFNLVVDKIEERDFYLYWIMKTGDANEVYSIVQSLKKNSLNQNILLVVLISICFLMNVQKSLIQ